MNIKFRVFDDACIGYACEWVWVLDNDEGYGDDDLAV